MVLKFKMNLVKFPCWIVPTVLLSTLITHSLMVDAKGEVQGPPDVSADKDTICEATTTPDADKKVGITGFMDYDDLLKLIVWNHKYNLRKGEKKFEFPAEVNWKRNILEKLAAIFTKACPAEYVTPEFINVATELFMVYQNSVDGSVDHSETWNSFLPILDECTEIVDKFEMTSAGFEAKGFKIKNSEGEVEEVDLLPPSEHADSALDLDLIIDTVWWLFSFSFGSCYWTPGSPSIWSSRFKRLFYGDFLNDLKSRWLHAGPETDFGVIFGDFNIRTTLHNIRVCTTGAYTKNGIADRQLVRSLTLAPSNYGIETGINRKIGDTI